MNKRKWTREEVYAYADEHGRMFYANRDDANLFVRKRYGIGWTMNMGNPLSWFVTAGIVLVVAIAVYFK